MSRPSVSQVIRLPLVSFTSFRRVDAVEAIAGAVQVQRVAVDHGTVGCGALGRNQIGQKAAEKHFHHVIHSFFHGSGPARS
jgi:hypothetical protein